MREALVRDSCGEMASSNMLTVWLQISMHIREFLSRAPRSSYGVKVFVPMTSSVYYLTYRLHINVSNPLEELIFMFIKWSLYKSRKYRTAKQTKVAFVNTDCSCMRRLKRKCHLWHIWCIMRK